MKDKVINIINERINILINILKDNLAFWKNNKQMKQNIMDSIKELINIRRKIKDID